VVTARHLLTFVHLTDLQLVDVSSPGRLEFLQRLVGRADLAPMLPSYRAHELLAAHAFETMLSTINRLTQRGVGGRRPQFALTTGDNIDNQQWNELDPPDAEEKARNDLIEQLQGTRNPYIDDPDLAKQLHQD